MDTGIISSRYATALLRYAAEQGCEETVYREAQVLTDVFGDGPLEEKIDLVRTSLGGTLSPATERFLGLLSRNGRTGYARFIFQEYVRMYLRHKGIVPAELTAASEPSEALIASLKALVKKTTGYEAQIRTVVDPQLIGGFVLDLGDRLLDASVATQLEKIRQAFIDKNRRIV